MGKITDGAELREAGEAVHCPGFGARIRLEDCTAENCKFHLGVKEDVKIEGARFVVCGRPMNREIFKIYEIAEVKNGGTN